MNDTISFTYTSSNPDYPGATVTFTGNDNLSSLSTYIGTIGRSNLLTIKLTGNGHGSAWNLFSSCSNLTTVDLSDFNTSDVTSFSWMFAFCSKLTTLNLNNFNIQNVSDFSWMFGGCSALTTIYCDNDWSLSSGDSSSMFYNCYSLVGAISYDSNKTDIQYANPTTGYFTPVPTIENIKFNGNTISKVYFNGNKIFG